MRHSKFLMQHKGNSKFIATWFDEEGVFLTPQGKWIARVRKGSLLTTISQHER